MNWYKIAQITPALATAVHSTSQRPIVYLTGNTYPIKQFLKPLGFSWYKAKKMWWMYRDRFDSNLERNITGLKEAGVDVSAVNSQTVPEQPQTTPEQPTETEEPQSEVSVETDQITNTKEYANASFPVNPDIYHTNIEIEHNGQPLTLYAQWAREPDDKYRVTMPKYKLTISWNNKVLVENKPRIPKNYRWSKRGPNFDENQMIADLTSKIPDFIANPRSNAYAALEYELAATNREPEFQALLEKFQNASYDEKFPDIFPNRIILLNEQGYEGQYSISITPNMYASKREFEIQLYTNVEHKLAPRPKQLIYFEIPPTITNIKETNEYIDQFISQNFDKIQKEYIKYLNSFAFTESQQEQSQQELKPIVDMIASGNVDSGFIRNELLKRQYIRPSKRVKKNVAPGMSPADSFNLIIDDKAIRDATFDGDADSPEYFYTAIAYNLMRIKHNNISFIPINLEDAYYKVTSLLKRYYDPNTSKNDVSAYIDSAARAVFSDLTGSQYKSWEEVYADFYGNSTSGGQEEQWQPGQSGQRSQSYVLNTFANFVGSLNLGITTEQAMENPKGTYRQLALKIHPDTTQLDSEYAHKAFAELSILYNNLPPEIINAFNWYGRVKLASV